MNDDPLDTLLGRLPDAKPCGEGRWKARCPAHEDNKPSLDVTRGGDGRALVICRAGCTAENVVGALGLSLADLFPPKGAPLRATPSRPAHQNATRAGSFGRVVATYDYTDSAGNLLYQVQRSEVKQFRQRRPDGCGGFVWNLQGVRLVPCALREVLAAIATKRAVFVAEGERDADNLRRLGLTATTNNGGADTPRSWQEFAPLFAGATVVILPDNDEAGRKHAQSVARALHGTTADLRVLELPGLPGKGDVSDWLASGGTADELRELARHAPAWTPEPAPITYDEVPVAADAAGFGPNSTPVVCLADVQPETVRWLWAGRVPFGKITLLDGDPGLGKSTLSLDIAARLSVGGVMPGETEPVEPAAVLLLACEDGLADTVRPRLEAAGAAVGRVFSLSFVPEPDGKGERPPALPEDIATIEEVVTAHEVRLVIVDPLMAFLSERVNSFKDQDVRRALAPLAAMAERTGAAVLVLRHLNKMSNASAIYRGGGSIGISGAARSVLLVAKHPDDENRRVLASIKNNLAPPPCALAFHLRSDEENAPARIAWEGESNLTADALLATQAPDTPATTSQMEEAKMFLRDLLAEGPVRADAVIREARNNGVSDATLRRAKTSLSVKPKREGGLGAEGHWVWFLPDKPDDPEGECQQTA